MRAVQITEFGGPEVLTLKDLPDPVASEGLVVIDVTSAGVNYADTHHAFSCEVPRTRSTHSRGDVARTNRPRLPRRSARAPTGSAHPAW